MRLLFLHLLLVEGEGGGEEGREEEGKGGGEDREEGRRENQDRRKG